MPYTGLLKNRIFELSVGIGSVLLGSLVTFYLFKKNKKKSRIIDTMNILNKDSVHIRDRDRVEEIVSHLIKGGSSKLQVISDFDHTLTRVHRDGKKCTTSYGILHLSPLITQQFKYEDSALFKHYHPIEIDPNLTRSEKEPFMVEWYTKSLHLMPSSGITKSCIPEMVAASNSCLRDGCDAMLESLYRNNIPVLVFSAGVGDIVKELLRQSNLLYPNIKLIANFMSFDEKEKLTGFKNGMIHTYNKNLSSMENKDYFTHLKSRSNIILLGDTMGDLDMVEGVPEMDAVLKIGFLNHKIEESLPEFLESYDIVLADDQTMDVAIGLLNSIF